MPMLLQRADDQYRWETPDTLEPPSTTARRTWYHTVGDGHIPALRCAIDSLGADGSCSAPTSPKKTGHPLRGRLHHGPEIDTGAARVILDQDEAPCSASDWDRPLERTQLGVAVRAPGPL